MARSFRIGSVALYEQFVGFDGRPKDRYFLIVCTASPVVVRIFCCEFATHSDCPEGLRPSSGIALQTL